MKSNTYKTTLLEIASEIKKVTIPSGIEHV